MHHVLVVDDDDAVREAVCMVLEDEGFLCQQAANGAVALAVLRASTDPLVVLLDLMMPHMSGRDVLDAVEADLHALGRHAFILLTAAGKTLPLALVQLLGRLDVPVIGKPFDIEPLKEAVTQAAKRLAGDASA